jgi:hypothetical protein
MPSRRILFQWHRRESNPQTPRFELGRFAEVCVPCRRCLKRPRWDLNPGTDRAWKPGLVLLRDRQASTPGCSTRTNWSVVSCQLSGQSVSVVSRQSSVVSRQSSVVGRQSSVVSRQSSVEMSRNRRSWFTVANGPLPTAYCQKRHAPKDLNPDQLGWNQPCCRLHQGRVCCRQSAEVTNPAAPIGARLEPTSRDGDHLFSRQAPHPAG